MTDRNTDYMRQNWGTSVLVTDYGWDTKKMLREVINDEGLPKSNKFAMQNELHSKIRNDDDYDDWNYGTEPLYEVTK
jgi:hypothetical protein